MHLAGLLAVGVLADNLGPQHARGAQFGNLHEIYAVDAEVELDVGGSLFSRNAGFGELLEILVAPGQSVAQILIAVGAGIGELVGVDGHSAEIGISLQGGHHLGRSLEYFTGVLALHHHLFDGVEGDAARDAGGVVALAAEVGVEQLGQLHAVALTGLEVELHAVAVDALEQLCDVVGAELVAGNLEAQRVHTALHDVERLGVGLLRTVAHDVLTHKPAVVGLLVTAHVGELARQGVHGGQLVHILLAIERLHGESFVGSPHHLFLIIRTLEVHLNLVAPFLTRGGCEVRKEFLFTFCHDFFGYYCF